MAKPFFDTNVLLYLLSGDTGKADRAETLLAESGMISVQVLNEFAAVARRKAKLPWSDIRVLLTTIQIACQVVPITLELHELALGIAERYQFTIYDSLIVAAAQSSGCDVLYSEDLQNDQTLGTVRVSNPFGAR